MVVPTRLTRAQLAVELARPWALFALFAALASRHLWWFAVPVAGVTALAAFVQMHDAMHASLGLSRRANHVVLTLSGLLLLKSGHGLQVTHLRHHGRCLRADDPEGAPATWALPRVLFAGPFHAAALRLHGLRIAPHTRGVQLAETAATALVLAGAVALYAAGVSALGLVYWAVAAAASATMPLWAAYVPHHLAPRNPARLAAARLARFWTPVVSSFAFHHVHHAHPKVPTALLAEAARAMGPDAQYEGHDHA
ncbi:MAG: hypothetical protein JWM10_3110 [Myxococcaceae bacterium]|nr:hypothetical protein [Myxococcaceae bacterium]